MIDLALCNNEFYGGQKMVSVYCNKQNTERFFVGSVVSSNSECLLMSLVAPQSHYDGLCFCTASSIYRIELQSQYLDIILRNRCPLPKLFSPKDPWDIFFEYAESNKLVVQVKRASRKRSIFGISMQHNNSTIILQRILLDGSTEKVYHLNRKDIDTLICESGTELEVQRKYQGDMQDVR